MNEEAAPMPNPEQDAEIIARGPIYMRNDLSAKYSRTDPEYNYVYPWIEPETDTSDLFRVGEVIRLKTTYQNGQTETITHRVLKLNYNKSNCVQLYPTAAQASSPINSLAQALLNG